MLVKIKKAVFADFVTLLLWSGSLAIGQNMKLCDSFSYLFHSITLAINWNEKLRTCAERICLHNNGCFVNGKPTLFQLS